MSYRQDPGKSSAGEAGFSLFESIVALAVFALAAVSAVSLVTQNVLSANQLEARMFAGFVAENILVETRLQPQLVLGVSDGEVSMGGYDFDWQRDIQETGETNLRSVMVSVRLRDAQQVLQVRNGFQTEPANVQ